MAALNEAIDNREEGLIVKNPTSIYCPDKRKGHFGGQFICTCTCTCVLQCML